MPLFKPPFVILEKSLLTSKVFFGSPAVYFIRIPISCSNATAILEYSTFNYITLQHEQMEDSRQFGNISAFI